MITLNMIKRLRIFLWNVLVNSKLWYLRLVYKMDIGENVKIARTVKLDMSVNPKGIHIGANSRLLYDSMVLSHDYCRKLICDTYIGKNCIIGSRVIILPGIKLGDECVVGAGSVVTKDVPNNCLVVGNPAKVIRTGIKVNHNGQIINKGETVIPC